MANLLGRTQLADLPEVVKDACLAFLVLASTTSTGAIDARLVLVEG